MFATLTASEWLLPVVCGSVWMIIGAVIDGWKLKVPNKITFPMILTGWAFWATQGLGPFGQSVAATFVAGALLLVPYAIGGMGAGDVKLYAGFGAWMVPIPWVGFENLLWAFAVSVLLGGLMAAAMILWRKTWYANLANANTILGDLTGGMGLGQIFDRAKQRKPTLQLLPYGVPLTIGSLAYLAGIHPWVAPVLMTVASR
jgi:prepilin peptidase CpaA